ncbi:unnamed protein product, partial [Oppiella nova]
MLPQAGTVKNLIEVDFVPWGQAKRELIEGKQVYTCANADTDCLGTRVHACIARNHVSLYQNHHEFFMVVCTGSNDNWKTNPLGNVISCSNTIP